jgi:chromosome segregation ATPase
MIAELSENIKGYENQITEVKAQMAKEGKEKEVEYTNRLSTLDEEKNKLEAQLKTSQDLLLEKDNAITLFKQQKEESENNLADQDKMIAELSENIKGYENQITEVKAQMAKEGKEKEVELTNRIATLSEEKSKLEAKLEEVIEKSKPNYYEVERGDFLWKIAERFYNQGEKWIRILEANTEKIKNPDLIYPYQRFTIPKE